MALPRMLDAERRARVAIRHRLHPETRTDDVAALTDDVVALHSSDPASVFLSAAVRMANPSVATIEDALYTERSILRHHAMRRTLWVMSPLTAARAHASTGRKVAETERRRLVKSLALSPEIGDAGSWLDDALRQVGEVVTDAGPITTRGIGERLPHLRVPLPYPGPGGTTVDIVAHTKVIQLAGFQGSVVRTRPAGTWISSQYRWAPMTDWCSEGIDMLDTADAAAALLLQWLERFGPGTHTDMKWWTGWTKTAVAKALDQIDAQEVELESGERGWVAPGDSDSVAPDAVGPWVVLLPGLDPTAMGWNGRDWFLDDDIRARVFDRNGNAGPTVWVDGRIVGGWTQRADGELATDILGPITSDQRAALEREVARLATFIGETRFKVRFPSPSYRELRRER